MLKNNHTCKITINTLLFGTLLSSPALAAEPPHDSDHVDEIIVSAAYEGRKLGETILGATILHQDDILRQLDGSLGETLRRQPGISSTFFGPGASRPIIRGLGGDRIRILDSSLGSIDASSTSPDHAVSVEPAMAERIEILRGTAMLMYGSSAAGGVVNVFDGRIPDQVPDNNVSAGIRYGHTSVNNGNEATVAMNGLIASFGGLKLVTHFDAMLRDTSDYDIPNYAESAILRASEELDEEDHDDDPQEMYGTVENSATNTKGGSAGLSLIGNDGFIGFNLKLLNSQYGVPAGHDHGDEHAEEEHEEEHEDEHEDEHHGEEEAPVSIDLNQIRFDVRGALEQDFLFFKKAKIRFGFADYDHKELEGPEVGTIFKNKGWEGRLDFTDKGGDNWNGATGIQLRSRQFSAIGAEAFVPATSSFHTGIYSVKEFSFDEVQIDVGARYEHTNYTVKVTDEGRSFNGVSLSTGTGFDLGDNSFIGLALFRTERAPSLEELFSNGPHLATNAYELGDTNLGMETALGTELTYTYKTEKYNFVINAFHTKYDDFIYENGLDQEIDGLPVFSFTAHDAKLYGFESKIEMHAARFDTKLLDSIDLHIDAQLDLVRTRLSGSGEKRHLPRIPPVSALVGFTIENETFNFRNEIEIASKQQRHTVHELPTKGYKVLNSYLTLRPFADPSIFIELRATNITNEDARQHTSFLKDLAPLPGRNIRFSIGARF